MTDKYHLEMIESATGVLTDDEQGLLVMLPIELRDAFVLLATHDRATMPPGTWPWRSAG